MVAALILALSVLTLLLVLLESTLSLVQLCVSKDLNNILLDEWLSHLGHICHGLLI